MHEDNTSGAGKRGGGIALAWVIWVIPVFGIFLGARRWLPPLASEHGIGIDQMLNYTLITVGALFVIGHLALGYFILRFRNKDTITFRLASPKSERRWSLIPVVVMALIAEGGVLVIGLPVWGKLYAANPPANAVNIEVTAEQFGWNVRYPGLDGRFGRIEPRKINLENVLGMDRKDADGKDDILLMNEITVPVGRPVQIRLRSKDTLHSFFLPNFRVKQDAVPGMSIQVGFVPTVKGEYELACAELCGLGHYSMRGLFHVVTEEEFQKWLSEQDTYF